MNLRLRPRAKLDLDDAYAWYEAQRPGLVMSCLSRSTPRSKPFFSDHFHSPEIEQHVRRALVKRFPYGSYFMVEQSEIVVFAIYHAKRNPRGWQARL